MTTLESVKYNLANLHRFGGRETPEQFWPCALSIFFSSMAIFPIIMLPWFVDTMTRMRRYAAEHPENTTVTSGPGHYSISVEGGPPDLFGDMSGITRGVALVFALAAVLLAAAVTRRLHDRGLSGLFGLLPIPFFTIAMIQLPRLFAEPPDGGTFALLFLNNIAYLGSLFLLAVLLARRPDPGPNRYGDPQ